MTDAEQFALDIWQIEAEIYDQVFRDQLELDKKALRRKRMINRVEGILIAVIVMMIIELVR